MQQFSLLYLLYVAIGGAVGSVARYLSMSFIGKIIGTGFPYSTLIVNIFGSFLMGVWIVTMSNWLPERGKDLHLLFAVGVLGGFTTFSTFSLDLFYLVENGAYLQATLYAFASVLVSLLTLIAGMWLVKLVAI